MTVSWLQRSDGLIEVDGDVVVATRQERAIVDRVIGRWGSLVRRSSRRTGVPYAWLVAFIRAESSGDPTLTSSVGAVGLMQIMPSTFRLYRPGASEAEMFDPATNIDVGAEYLAKQRKMGRDIVLSAAAYNAGNVYKSSSNRWGLRQDCPGGDGECYIDRVVRAYNYVVLRTLRVMLAGDSIMLGAVPSIVEATSGLPIEFVGRQGSAPMRHEAVKSESIAAIAARLVGAFAANPPDVVVHMAGSNDVPGQSPPSAMAEAQSRALDTDLQHASAVIAVAVPEQPAAARYGRQNVPSAYNHALAALVARKSSKPIAFLDTHLTEADNGPDGVHLTTPGTRKLAEGIADALARVASISREIVAPSSPWYRHPLVYVAGLGLLGYGAWRAVDAWRSAP